MLQTLEKTYVLEPTDDVIPKKFIGSKINWKDSSVDPTVEQVRSWAEAGRKLCPVWRTARRRQQQHSSRLVPLWVCSAPSA